MKTFKFILFFNLFFYSSMLFTLIFASLVVYQIDFNSLKLILIKLYNFFPVIFSIVNITLIFILIFEFIYKWSVLQMIKLHFSDRTKRSFISGNKLSLSN
ncbi:MAG: hypothetical protein ACOYO1_04005 [Bacteroidales bacterium]